MKEPEAVRMPLGYKESVMITLTGICSGGQSGADLAGLCAAEELGIYTFGWAPKGWKTEAGPAPWLEDRFNMMEHSSDYYAERTKANVLAADATVIFGRRSKGSNLTENLCHKHKKPLLWIAWIGGLDCSGNFSAPLPWGRVIFDANPVALAEFVTIHDVKILNVAGNRESVNPGIFEFTKDFILKAFQ